jgi:hypothetical protein
MVDVIVEALSSFECVALDFCFGGALIDLILCVIPHPPIAGSWDFENHQLTGVAWDPCDGVLQGNRSVAFV